MRRSFAACGLAVLLMVSACGQAGVPAPVQHISMRLTDSTSGFGLALLDRLLAEKAAGNVFISPLSATIALSMAASAADAGTRAQILRVLGIDPTAAPDDQARQTIERLAQSDSDAQLELAQAIWAQNGLALNPDYANSMRTDYQAQLGNLDFTSPDAPAIVNKWVSDKTHGKITQLVDSFDPTTVGYLVNETFFHALWATEFKPMNGKEEFHQFDGTAAQLPFMSREENVTELRMPGYVAELLPYKGGRFSAVLILPASTLSPSELGTFLSPTLWAQTLAYFHRSVGDVLGGKCTAWSSGDVNVQCDGSLQMPKFKLDYGKDLTSTLGAMGMPIPGAALPQFCAGCAISTVVQKTYLEVDEQGTTAAAATGVAVESALKLPTIVNRPFAFALIDNATDAPLFLGAIGNLG